MSREPVEQIVIDRLSIFPSSFTLDAATEVCVGGMITVDHIVDVVEQLAEQTLHVIEQDGQTRYNVPEPLREVAHQRLLIRGEANLVQRQFVRYYTVLVKQITRQLFHTRDVGVGIAQLEAELENIRAVLRWHIEQDAAAQGLQLAGGSPTGVLLDFWIETARVQEGRDWLAQLLALPSAVQPTKVRAYGLHDAAVLAWIAQDYAAAEAYFEESLAIMRELDSKAGITEMLDHLGRVLHQQHNYPAACARLEECLAIYRAWGKQRAMVESLGAYGLLLRDQGDIRGARAALEECLRIYRDWGSQNG